jgi:hypothetical protein
VHGRGKVQENRYVQFTNNAEMPEKLLPSVSTNRVIKNDPWIGPEVFTVNTRTPKRAAGAPTPRVER